MGNASTLQGAALSATASSPGMSRQSLGDDARPVQGALRTVVLLGGNQSQVPVRKGKIRHPRHGAIDGKAGIFFNGLAG